MRTSPLAAGAAAALVLAGCGDSTGGNAIANRDLTAAFTAAPVAAADLSTSFVGASAEQEGDSTGWMGRGEHGHGPGRDGLMGGGLDEAFVGGIRFDGQRGGRHGPFAIRNCEGSFDVATGRVICATRTLRNGLTVARSIAFTDASGAPQADFDSATTNAVSIRSSVSGTVSFTRDDDGDGQMSGDDRGGSGGSDGSGGRGGHGHDDARFGRLFGDTATIVSATTTVQSESGRSVTGLAPASAARTVAGTSTSQETTTGVSSRGTFTLLRVAGDTTTGLVIPVSTGGPTYPTAGKVVRSMSATLGYEGQAPLQASRREVVTYDGSATATVVITENGTTRSCTRALPRGPLSCP